MKKFLILSIIALMAFTSLGMTECSVGDPPDLLVSLETQKVEVLVSKEYWGNEIYDRVEPFAYMIETFGLESLVVANLESEILLKFKGKMPDSFTLSEYALTIYEGELKKLAEIDTVDVVFTDKQASLSLAEEMSAYRGFVLKSRFGENACEYAFIVRVQHEYPQIKFVRDGNVFGSENVFIDSRSQLDDYLNKLLKDPQNQYSPVYEQLLNNFSMQYLNYGQEFFAENRLFLARIVEGSGSIRHKVREMSYVDDLLYVALERESPAEVTDDMAYWTMIVEIPKDDFAGREAVVERLPITLLEETVE